MEVVITIAEFKKLLKAQGYAESTIEGYRKNLDQFSGYLQGEKISVGTWCQIFILDTFK